MHPMVILLAALIATTIAHDSVTLKSPESVRIAIPKVTERPVLNGKLDDPVWAKATQLTDFFEYEPNDMRPGRQKNPKAGRFARRFFLASGEATATIA